MVQGVVIIDVSRHSHAYETSAARRVGQRFPLVRRADKRGVAAILLDCLAVRRPELHVGRREQILQHHLLSLCRLVKLIDVYQSERSQRDVQVKLILEVYLVVIIVAQLRRHQYLAESRLSASLLSYEQRHQRIACQLLVALAPLCHHSREPHPQVLRPVRLIRRHPRREVGYIVVSVPLGQFVQPSVHRVILLYACRVDEAVHILVPRLQPHLYRPERHIIAHLLGQRLKRLVVAELLAILCHTRQQVLAHIKIGIKEYLRPHGLYRLLGHALQRLDLMFLHIILLQSDGIDGGKDIPYQHLVPCQHRVAQRHALCVGQWDTLLQTGCSDAHEQLHLAVLVGQLKVASQHIVHYGEPVQVISPHACAPRHQLVALRAYHHGSQLLRLPRVGQECACLGIEIRLRVGAEIYRPLKCGLQILYVHQELVLIGHTCRVI